MRTQRIAGKVRAEHIASLGSVDARVSVRERLAFWAKLTNRLGRLANRVGPDDHAKIYGALHARIPMVTPEEQRALQEENAKADERFWDMLHGLNASQIEDYQGHIARAETKIAEMAPEMAKAAERVETARSRLEKLRRGEDVAGGLGKPFDWKAMEAILKAAGWTPRDFRRMALLGKLTNAETETLVKNMRGAVSDATNRATEREARRIVRARTS